MFYPMNFMAVACKEYTFLKRFCLLWVVVAIMICINTEENSSLKLLQDRCVYLTVLGSVRSRDSCYSVAR